MRFLLRAPMVVQEISEEETPLDGNVTYSNPEETLNENSTTSQRVRTASTQAHGVPDSAPKPTETKTKTIEKDKNDPYANVGRNDPCPCGSGKKFKKCHGANR